MFTLSKSAFKPYIEVESELKEGGIYLAKVKSIEDCFNYYQVECNELGQLVNEHNENILNYIDETEIELIEVEQ